MVAMYTNYFNIQQHFTLPADDCNNKQLLFP